MSRAGGVGVVVYTAGVKLIIAAANLGYAKVSVEEAISLGNLLSVRASGPQAPGCSMSSHAETNDAVA